MDSSSGWATTSSTFRLLLSPGRRGRKCGLGGRQDGAGEDRIRPSESAHRSTAPAAARIQIHAMEWTPGVGLPLLKQANIIIAGGDGNGSMEWIAFSRAIKSGL
jgi:hypothetical protein